MARNIQGVRQDNFGSQTAVASPMKTPEYHNVKYYKTVYNVFCTLIHDPHSTVVNARDID